MNDIVGLSSFRLGDCLMTQLVAVGHLLSRMSSLCHALHLRRTSPLRPGMPSPTLRRNTIHSPASRSGLAYAISQPSKRSTSSSMTIGISTCPQTPRSALPHGAISDRYFTTSPGCSSTYSASTSRRILHSGSPRIPLDRLFMSAVTSASGALILRRAQASRDPSYGISGC